MNATAKARIIVTLPAYNEEKTIGKVLADVKSAIAPYSAQILVVDDGSTDKTAKVARESGAIVVSHFRNSGLAEVFRTEIKKCIELGTDIIVHIDSDGQYMPKEIPKLLAEINNGYDLVLGSRFAGRIEQMPLIKRVGNILFSKVISAITKVRITDGQTGFRAFTLRVAEELPIRSNHTYTQEQIIRAVRHHFRIKEVPCTFLKRTSGESRLIRNPLEYALKAWINVLRIYRDYEPLKFFGSIGLLFLFPGFLLGSWLVYLFITTGVVGHLPSALLTVLLMSFGIQFMLFAFLADMLQNE